MSALRPVAGIICCNRTVGAETAQAVMNRYVTATIDYADVAALLVPSLPDQMRAAEVASRLDGLLLTGSPSNLEAHRYGEAVDDAPGPFDAPRDSMTQDLIAAMLDLGRPVFGICRGFQELNVAFGGSLRRDVSTAQSALAHHAPDDVDFEAMFDHVHPVSLTQGGILARRYGLDQMVVNSVHYQGIARLGDGLDIEAYAPDGLVEAISAKANGAEVLAVQWHPEWRTSEHPRSQDFFALFGAALRGAPIRG